MRIRVSLRKGEWEALLDRLHQAYGKGEVRLLRRIHALMSLFEGKTVAEIAELLKLSEQTIYNYVKAFILNRLDSLVYKRPPGRAPKLSKTQKQVLAKLIERGPQAAGYDCGCWDTTLIQELILIRFGRAYSVHYVAELLTVGAKFTYMGLHKQ